jgi:hypothetical protein
MRLLCSYNIYVNWLRCRQPVRQEVPWPRDVTSADHWQQPATAGPPASCLWEADSVLSRWVGCWCSAMSAMCAERHVCMKRRSADGSVQSLGGKSICYRNEDSSPSVDRYFIIGKLRFYFQHTSGRWGIHTYCHVTGFGIVTGFIGHFQNVATNNYGSLTVNYKLQRWL